MATDVPCGIHNHKEQPNNLMVGLVQYTKRDLILYAFGIGCDENERCYLYEHDPSFSAFPLFLLSLPFRAKLIRSSGSESLTDVSLDEDYNALGMYSFPPPMMREHKSVQSIIHLAQKYRLHDFKTIPLGTNKIELITRIIHTKNTKKGKIITSETLFFVLPNSNLKDAEKWLLATAQMTSLYLSSDHNEGSYEVHRPSQTLRPISNIINTSHEVHTVQIFKIHESQAMMYRLSGDTNRIHVEGSTFFKSTQPILHGLCTLGYAVRAVLKTYGGIFQYVDCSFTYPVFVGDTIAVHMWKGQNANDASMILIRFQVTRQDEEQNQHEIVIKGGVIQLNMGTSENKEIHNNSKL